MKNKFYSSIFATVANRIDNCDGDNDGDSNGDATSTIQQDKARDR